MGFIFLMFALTMLVLRWGFKQPIQKLFGWMALFVICILVHLGTKGYRWPYLFVYITPAIVLLDVLLDPLKKILRALLRIIWLLPAFGFLMLLAFPIVSLDPPSGPYQVGTMVMNIQDEDRIEIYDDSGKNRDIRVQVFYPTVSDSKDYVPWFLDGEASVEAFAEGNFLPPLFFSHLTDVKSHSLVDVPVATDGPYPVVILSHGWGSSRILHINISEMLASHGYIVFAIDHTYVATMTRTKDAEIVSHKRDILPEEDFLDEAEEMIEVFSQDIALVRNHLKYLQEAHPLLKGSMNLFNVGLIGHSTGAGGVVKYAMSHEVNCVIGLDAWVEPITDLVHLDEPTLFLRSEEWIDAPNNENLKKLTFNVYNISESRHQDFTIAEKLTPLMKWINWSGKSSSKIQEDMILKYLESTMKGIEQDLDFDEIDRVRLTHP